MKGSMSGLWTSVNGPRPVSGDRRQTCASDPKVWAHWDDSSSSLAPS